MALLYNNYAVKKKTLQLKGESNGKGHRKFSFA